MYLTAFNYLTILTIFPVSATERHSHSMMLPPPCLIIGTRYVFFCNALPLAFSLKVFITSSHQRLLRAYHMPLNSGHCVFLPLLDHGPSSILQILTWVGRPAIVRVIVIIWQWWRLLYCLNQSFRNSFILLPRSMSWHDLIIEVYGEFLERHGLLYGLTCTENCANSMHLRVILKAWFWIPI